MKITGQVTRIFTEEIGVVCDVCKNKEDGSSPDGWYSFSSGHGEWGNDSVDSYENHDVCSPKCYFSKIRSLLAENENYKRSFEADNKDWTFLNNMVTIKETV